MPNAMGSPGLSLAFYYGPEHQRVTQISSSQGTTYYLNPGNNGDLLYEKDIKPNNSTEQRNYITAYGQVVAMVKLTNGTTWTTRYLHRDNLGSVTAITNEAGAVIERLAYEPFGKRRFANGSNDTNNTILPQNTDRGYTNHEHLDELTLIHMNGRVYDPVAGRFMSADPHIQDPMNLQSYNRYAYVMNNPLGYTDPSGYLSLFGHKILPGVFNNKNAKIAVIAVAAWYTGGLVANSAWATCTLSGATWGSIAAGAAGGAVAGGLSGAIYGGTLESTLKGAAYGGISGGIGGAFAGSGAWGNMIGGGVNGYLQTGTTEGFLRGMAAGALPENLGFDAYYNKAAANIVIGAVRDGVKGMIVANNRGGFAHGVKIGQMNNAIGHLVGIVTTGSLPTFVPGKDAGVFTYTDKQRGGYWEQRGALTVGNVISGPSNLMTRTTETGVSVYAHELDHFKNPVERSLGAAYGAVHILDLAVGNLGYKLGQGANWFMLEEHVQRHPYSSMGLYQ